MTLEQLEFSITQYLDGTLPPEEQGALEERLATDPQAQALLDEHQSLTALLRSQPIPELDWADVARDLSAVVTGTVSEQSRPEDQKLNTILKAATPLPEIRWDALSRRISEAVDAEVASTDSGDEQFDDLLRAASPMPAVNWDRLASHLSSAVAAEASREDADEPPAVIGRIGFGWVRAAAGLAVAACVLVGTTLGLRTYWGGKSANTGSDTRIVKNDVKPAANPDPEPIVVLVPTPEGSDQPAVADITVGPSKEYAGSYDESYTSRRNRSPVVILTPATRPSLERQDEFESWMGIE
jgi:negative regulator of sigma E activity